MSGNNFSSRSWSDLAPDEQAAVAGRLKRVESRQRTRMKKKNEKLPEARQIHVEKIDFLAICIAQDWKCSICGDPMIILAPSQHPKAVSLEHDLSVMCGGDHVERNVSGAHRKCNARKGHYEDAPKAAEIKRMAGETGQRARRERRKEKQLSLWPTRKLESRDFQQHPTLKRTIGGKVVAR